MKKGTIFEGMVEKVKYPNRGVIMTQDGPAEVKNVLPGQRVSCSVTKSGKGRMEGRQEHRAEIVRTMSSKGKTPREISDLTDIPLEDIETILSKTD